MSSTPDTIVHLLNERVRDFPNKRILTYLRNGEIAEVEWTYSDLYQEALKVAIFLQSSANKGDRAIILLPQSPQYVAAIFGCFIAGIIAVPAYPPKRNRIDQRIEAIYNDCNPKIVFANQKIRETSKKHNSFLSGAEWYDFGADSGDPGDFVPELITSKDIAILQYTSGSTGLPKGVIVTHLNLIANSRILTEGFELSDTDTSVSWLPLFHDMGLIEGLIQPIFANFHLVLMAPRDFVQKPIRWLMAITKYKATHAGSPNFGYDLCIERIHLEMIESLDLSTVKCFYNGAETVRKKTIYRFYNKFKTAGLSEFAMVPCYGMAEATLMITGAKLGELPKTIILDKDRLANNQVSIIEDETKGISLVGNGFPKLDTEIRIVNPETKNQVSDDEVGEVWVKGRSVTRGYWGNLEATKGIFNQVIKNTKESDFLRTGDIGFIYQDQLFLTGRLKDLIIIRGQNYYPADIESIAAEAHDSLQSGGSIAFSVEDFGSESFIVVQELKRTFINAPNTKEIIFAIRDAITGKMEITPKKIVLVRTKSVLKTSSGKLRRLDTKKQFKNRELSVIDSWEFR